jgi:glutamine synthetase
LEIALTPQEVLDYAKKNEARQVDLRFTDLPGLSQHISYPISMLEEDSFEDGFGIDGSSIRGWAAINESDMLIIPDPTTAFMDPFAETRTVVMLGDIVDPITRQHYDRDPRWIAKKAELHLKNSGIADTAYFGAEAEFFIFDNIRFDQNQHSGYYFIDAEEGRWNSSRETNNLGYRPRYKEGYFPVPPTDHYQDLRSEMVSTMIECGLTIECHHHEVATGGQCEIDQRFDTLVKSADNWRSGTSAVCCATRAHFRRSSPPRPTVTSAWCPDLKPPSILPTHAVTGPPPSAFPCIRAAPNRSASNSARPMHHRTRTSPSPP